MNKSLFNEIIAEALRSGGILSKNADICPVEQETQIDVRRFQNPITDNGDIRTQSIDASERIADFINSFGTVSDLEECYMIVLEGIQGIRSVNRIRTNGGPVSVMAAANSAVTELSEWYVDLSRKIQKMNIQSAGDKSNGSISKNEV